MPLSLSIVKQPAASLTHKILPVYNGLPFIVTSNNFNRQNFKYVADIYVNNKLVTTLKHNKDITALNYGIFDIGRVVENFIKTPPTIIGSNGFTTSNQSATALYQIKFGAEYERYIEFTSISNNAGNSRLSINNSLNGQHDVVAGDYITIQNASNNYYNGTFLVISVTTLTITISKPFTNTASGLLIEGEGFFDNYYVNNIGLGGVVGFAISNSRPSKINIGDLVVVQQNSNATIKGYNGEWLVVDKLSNVNIGGAFYTVIVTNCPFFGSTPINGGSIYSKSKYKYRNTVTSSVEYAWDAALQYKEALVWNPSVHSMNVTNKGAFLTRAPIAKNIRLNEIDSLSFFNTSITGGPSVSKGVFKTYNAANSLITSASYFMPITSLIRIDLMTGTKNIFVSVPLNGVSYYTVELQDSASNRLSEIRRYNLDRVCYRYSQYRFKWLNRLGGWDYFTFNLRSDKSVSVQRSLYSGQLKTYQPNNSTFNYKMGDSTNRVYNVKANDSEVVFSNWLTNAESSWLEELFTSPEVYMLIGDTTDTLPIILTDTDYTIGEKENIGLLQYKIGFKYSNNKVIQRG